MQWKGACVCAHRGALSLDLQEYLSENSAENATVPANLQEGGRSRKNQKVTCRYHAFQMSWIPWGFGSHWGICGAKFSHHINYKIPQGNAGKSSTQKRIGMGGVTSHASEIYGTWRCNRTVLCWWSETRKLQRNDWGMIVLNHWGKKRRSNKDFIYISLRGSKKRGLHTFLGHPKHLSFNHQKGQFRICGWSLDLELNILHKFSLVQVFFRVLAVSGLP